MSVFVRLLFRVSIAFPLSPLPSVSVCLPLSSICLFWRSMLTLDLLSYTKSIQSPVRLVMLSHSSALLQGRNPSSDSVEDGFFRRTSSIYGAKAQRCHKDKGFLMWNIQHGEMSADKQLRQNFFYLTLTPSSFIFYQFYKLHHKYKKYSHIFNLIAQQVFAFICFSDVHAWSLSCSTTGTSVEHF